MDTPIYPVRTLVTVAWRKGQWYAAFNSTGKEVEDVLKKEWLLLAGALLLFAHMVIIMDDVQAVIHDPNIENKPAEVAKLAIDLSQYWPK